MLSFNKNFRKILNISSMLNKTSQLCFLLLLLGVSTSSAGFGPLQGGLPDGSYLIERILPGKPKINFPAGHPLADAIRSDNSQEGSMPYSSFYHLFLSGDNFIIRQMVDGQDDFVSNEIFFASISDEGSWAFVEKADRITIIPHPSTDTSEGGPISGLLASARSFSNELRFMGLLIDWDSVKLSDDGGITGVLSQMGSFTGSVIWGENQDIKGINYKLSDGTEYNVDMRMSSDKEHVSETSISKRVTSLDAWTSYVKYRVIRASELPNELNMMTFWETYRRATTKVLLYDPETNSLTYRTDSGLIREVGDYNEPESASRRSLILFGLVFVVISIVPVVVAFRARLKRVG